MGSYSPTGTVPSARLLVVPAALSHGAIRHVT